MENNIVMIKTEHLHPHPDNPRKDLGDLSELTESIKKNGIMQNLTVVPAEEPGEYMVVIGHSGSFDAKIHCDGYLYKDEDGQLLLYNPQMSLEDLT